MYMMLLARWLRLPFSCLCFINSSENLTISRLVGHDDYHSVTPLFAHHPQQEVRPKDYQGDHGSRRNDSNHKEENPGMTSHLCRPIC